VHERYVKAMHIREIRDLRVGTERRAAYDKIDACYEPMDKRLVALSRAERARPDRQQQPAPPVQRGVFSTRAVIDGEVVGVQDVYGASRFIAGVLGVDIEGLRMAGARRRAFKDVARDLMPPVTLEWARRVRGRLRRAFLW
jgi:hypothetical protein